MSDLKEQAKRQNKRMVLIIVAIFVVALVIFGGGAYLLTRTFAGHVDTADDYSTVELVAAEYTDDLTVEGTIDASDDVVVTPEVDGTVKSVEVKDGETVKKGDVLFTMENKSLVKEKDKAKENLTVAKENKTTAHKDLSTAASALKKAKKKLTKQKAKLAAAEKSAESADASETDEEASSVDLTPYQDAVDSAQDAVNSAQNAYSAAQALADNADDDYSTAKDDYDDLCDQVDNLTVKAPSDGTVSQLNVKKGVSSKSLMDEEGAMQIVDMETLLGIIQVPETEISNVYLGQTVTVTCSVSDDPVMATVVNIAETPTKAKSSDGVDSSSYYKVQLDLGTIEKGMKVGMSIEGSIQVKDFGTVYYVPSTCLSSSDNGDFVEAVYDDNTVKELQVTKIADADNDEVVIQGSSLTDGMKIRADLS